jgi:hypothetical protein
MEEGIEGGGGRGGYVGIPACPSRVEPGDLLLPS